MRRAAPGGAKPESRSRRGACGRTSRVRTAARALTAAAAAARRRAHGLCGGACGLAGGAPAGSRRRAALGLRACAASPSAGGVACCAAGLRRARRPGLRRRRRAPCSGVALVDRRGGRLHVDAGRLERLEQLLAGDAPLLRYLVDALLRHARLLALLWRLGLSARRRLGRSRRPAPIGVGRLGAPPALGARPRRALGIGLLRGLGLLGDGSSATGSARPRRSSAPARLLARARRLLGRRLRPRVLGSASAWCAGRPQ